MDPIRTALGGLQAASARFEASAERTARMGSNETVDPATEVVEQVQAKSQFVANLKVVRVADSMMDALLKMQDVHTKT